LFENLCLWNYKNYSQDQKHPYVISGLVGFVGYAVGRVSSGLGRRKYEVRLAEIDLERQRETNRAAIMGLEHEEAGKKYARQKQTSEIEYERQGEVEQSRINMLTDLSEKLRPVFDAYLKSFTDFQALTGDRRKEVLKLRQAYREELVDGFRKALESEDISVHNDEYTIAENDSERLCSFIDTKFPLDELKEETPELPEELSEFIALVRKEISSSD